MKQQGKFVLMTLDEFVGWLKNKAVTRKILLIQQHHTYTPGYRHFNGSNHFALLAGMEKSHKERGFTEIGQNITTFPDGMIAVCRDFNNVPAGIKGANANGICIEHIGCFDPIWVDSKGNKYPGDTMTKEHHETIIGITVALCKRFKLSPSTKSIVYHHWYDLNSGIRTNGTGTAKTCPGSAFFGGNKVIDAEVNFIPLIRSKMR